jgi:hypothetical protein
MGESHLIDLQEMPSILMECKLAAILCKVLKLDAIHVHENFFDVGG